jgi:hypothetical protein
MKEEFMTDASLREYLLGKMDDAERERIENLFLSDSQAKERLLAAEQDLIEDYLEDSLTNEDKKRFLSIFAQTDEQRRKLRITKSIKDWALTEASVPQPVPAKESSWDRFFASLRLQPAFAVSIVLVMALGVVLFFLWSNSRSEKQRRVAIEQELAAYNSPERLREVPSNLSTLDLRPGTLRSVERERELRRVENQLVELRLPWIQKERYATYRAEVRRSVDDESFTIRNVQADNSGTIRLRIPPQFLSAGQYQINLSGITSDGTPGPAEQYNFVVSN